MFAIYSTSFDRFTGLELKKRKYFQRSPDFSSKEAFLSEVEQEISFFVLRLICKTGKARKD